MNILDRWFSALFKAKLDKVKKQAYQEGHQRGFSEGQASGRSIWGQS